MGKLHLKRTPEEQHAHDLRKARKTARKAAKRSRHATSSEADDPYADTHAGPSHKRPRTSTHEGADDYVFDFDFDSGLGSPSASHHARKPDADYVRAQFEEDDFRDKMWGALGDDERLDGVEASLNGYMHVPRRWRGGGMDRLDDELGVDPQMMAEEDYAEWVRDNMWKYVLYHLPCDELRC